MFVKARKGESVLLTRKERDRRCRLSMIGLSPEEFEGLIVKQEGRCASCREPVEKLDFHIDHDHCSGVVRGLLCRFCNTALGLLRDDVEKMENLVCYLKKHSYYLFDWPPIVVGKLYVTEKERRKIRRAIVRRKQELADKQVFE